MVFQPENFRNQPLCTLNRLTASGYHVSLSAWPAPRHRTLSVGYDLLLKGGRVIDPEEGLDDVLDVAFDDGRVAQVAATIAPEDAGIVFDATGKLVLPGFVDIHAHLYHGATALSWHPDELASTGVSCAVDGGTTGWTDLGRFREEIIDRAAISTYAFVNVMPAGLTRLGHAGAPNPDPDAIAETIEVIRRHRDVVIGVKVMLPSEGSPMVDRSLEWLQAATQVAAATETRVLCHIDGGLALSILIDQLRPGDIITHCFQGKHPAVVGPDGAVLPEVWAGRRKGIVFDMAPGYTHFDWSIAEGATRDGFWPDVISTDYSHFVMRGALARLDIDPSHYLDPAGGERINRMDDSMSMMLHLGMPLREVVAAATSRAAAAIGLSARHGSLGVGRSGDAVVVEESRGPRSYTGRLGEPRQASGGLIAVATVSRGVLGPLAA